MQRTTVTTEQLTKIKKESKYAPMEKSDLLQQVAHAFVPEGTRMVTRHLSHDVEATELTTGSALLMGARMLAETLEDNLKVFQAPSAKNILQLSQQKSKGFMQACFGKQLSLLYVAWSKVSRLHAFKNSMNFSGNACTQKASTLLNIAI